MFARKLVLVVSLLIAAGVRRAGRHGDLVEAAVALMAVSVFFMYLTGQHLLGDLLDTVEPAGSAASAASSTSSPIAPASSRRR